MSSRTSEPLTDQHCALPSAKSDMIFTSLESTILLGAFIFQSRALTRLTGRTCALNRIRDYFDFIFGSGFKRVNVRGSHYVYKKGDRILTVVKPHGGHKHCHWLDVKDVIKVLEED